MIIGMTVRCRAPRGTGFWTHPRVKSARAWSAERRDPQSLPFGSGAFARGASPSGAPRVAISVPGAVLPGADRALGPPPDPASFRQPFHTASSHQRQSPVVETDGDPRPPECGVTSPARRRHASPTFSERVHNAPRLGKARLGKYTIGMMSRGFVAAYRPAPALEHWQPRVQLKRKAWAVRPIASRNLLLQFSSCDCGCPAQLIVFQFGEEPPVLQQA